MPMLADMGFKKTLICIGGVMLAAGGPISLFSTSDLVSGIKRNWSGSAATTAATSPQLSVPATAPTVGGLLPVQGSTLDSLPTPSLDEVLRFNVTVEWVLQRWPRVSTGLPYLQLRGYRVPLVTGTAIADLAGSLTYYFNAQQQVERITLQGSTGDPSRLVALLGSRYHFARRLTNDPSLVLYEAVDSGNEPAGTLKIRSANVVQASQPRSRFAVELTMDRPR